VEDYSHQLEDDPVNVEEVYALKTLESLSAILRSEYSNSLSLSREHQEVADYDLKRNRLIESCADPWIALTTSLGDTVPRAAAR
jgi:hypothetical protein